MSTASMWRMTTEFIAGMKYCEKKVARVIQCEWLVSLFYLLLIFDNIGTLNCRLWGCYELKDNCSSLNEACLHDKIIDYYYK